MAVADRQHPVGLFFALWWLLTWLGVVWAASLTAYAQGAGSQHRIEAAWDKIEAAQSTGAKSAQDMSAASGVAPSFTDYATVGLGWELRLNAADFSGDPTVTFIVDDGPDFSLTPSGVSFPQVFESRDDKLRSYVSVGTRGLGHERVNTYISAVLRADLDGTTGGSPFQSVLDDHDGTKFDLSNAFIDVNGLGQTGFLSHVRACIGRQFIPNFRIGFLGSPVIDGGRFSYHGERADADLFSGRWTPFYESVSAFVGGGHFAYQLYPHPASDIGLAPYVEYLHVRDTDEGESAHRHTYGVRGQWKALAADGYFTAIDADPIELGLRGADHMKCYTFGKQILPTHAVWQ